MAIVGTPFWRKSLGARRACLSSAQTPQFYRVPVLGGVVQLSAQIGLAGLARGKVNDALCKLVRIARSAWTLLGHAR